MNNFKICNGCNVCKNECAFLQQYGNPGEIVRLCRKDPDKWMAVAFECSLCGLCTAVCPRQLDPAALFLEYRRELVKKGEVDFSRYKRFLNYEKKGTSKKYKLYHLPENCTTVFFPGCSLPGTRLRSTQKTYEYLKIQDKNIGIVLDCCHKISHDLGRQDHFEKMFSQMESFLFEKGVQKIIVACPSCHKIFDTYGKRFKVETVYDIMARCGINCPDPISGTITVHDPCPTRLMKTVQTSVRTIIASAGLEVLETPHQKTRTYCCGEGGSVGCMNPSYVKVWTRKRVAENQGHLMATYCAGCVNVLSKKVPAFHILDLVFDPKRTMAGKARVSSLFTCLNRLKLKKQV